MPLKIDPKTEKQLRNAKYGVYNHSAVQICAWTKKSLHNEGFCYKQKFYGIDTHRCMEFSPSAVFCEQNCIFCWRPMEFMKFRGMGKGEVDGPEEIYERLLDERRKLLSGFPGDGKTDMEKHGESLKPNHFAISLSGEPTLYPKLPELVRFLRNLPETRSVFIVTNGQEPGMMETLARSPPTQLYLSVNAPNKTLFERINCPVYKDGWERFLESLGIFSRLNTRRVLRLTMIKGMNMDSSFVKDYAELIEKGNPHFIEIKAYMW
ncbi:MAG: radical SAM protein, partial [Candidatus Aenigmarchaeota archaeon]